MQGAGCRVQGAGCEMWSLGCRVQGEGCRVQGVGCRVQGVGVAFGRGVGAAIEDRLPDERRLELRGEHLVPRRARIQGS